MKEYEALELNVTVSIRQPHMGGQIMIQEQFEIRQTDFLGMASLMKRFHDLVTEIKIQQTGPAEQKR